MSPDEIIQLIENLNKSNQLNVYVIIALSVNIIIIIIKFLFDLRLKNLDKTIYKKNILAKKCIETEEELYFKIEPLSLFDKNELDALLKSIQDIEEFVGVNKLHLSKNIFKLTNKILDYYKGILTNYRKKDYKQEIELIDQYVRNFNK